MPVYNYITKSAFLQQLSSRLYDSSQQFWSQAELGLYLNEALQTWNALTGYWRGDFTFASQQGVTWYDLTDTTNLPNTLRPLTLHDTDIYSLMQYHLLEAVAWNPWAGASAQFSASDLLNAVQSARDEVLSITGCTQTRSLVPAVAGRIQLPDTVIDIRRMAYLPAAFQAGGYGVGAYGAGPYGYSAYQLSPASVVWPEDTWGVQAFDNDFTSNPAGTPLAYLLSTEPPISFDTDAPPGGAGSYELLTVNAGSALTVPAPSLLLVPDDWAHVIKWGALGELLSRESNAKDIPRAEYCQQRYRLGLAALAAAPALLAMRLNNVPLQIDSVRSADQYNTFWQAQPQQKPSVALHSGLNLVALSPASDGVTYSMTATVVENAPLPVALTDSVQVPRDYYDAMLDYAQHLAAFKQGGDEFLRTMPLFYNFLKAASEYNGKLRELGEYTSILMDLSQRERDMNPVSTPDAQQAVTT